MDLGDHSNNTWHFWGQLNFFLLFEALFLMLLEVKSLACKQDYTLKLRCDEHEHSSQRS